MSHRRRSRDRDRFAEPGRERRSRSLSAACSPSHPPAPKRSTCDRTAWSVAAPPTACDAICRRSATSAWSSTCANCAGDIPDERRALPADHHHFGSARAARPGELHRQPGAGWRSSSFTPVLGDLLIALTHGQHDVFLYEPDIDCPSDVLQRRASAISAPPPPTPARSRPAAGSSRVSPSVCFAGTNVEGDWTLTIAGRSSRTTPARCRSWRSRSTSVARRRRLPASSAASPAAATAATAAAATTAAATASTAATHHHRRPLQRARAAEHALPGRRSLQRSKPHGKTPQGVTGTGQRRSSSRPTPATSGSSTHENVEMVVKMLDGCPITNHWWVFAGGLTDVEVTLTRDRHADRDGEDVLQSAEAAVPADPGHERVRRPVREGEVTDVGAARARSRSGLVPSRRDPLS